MAKPKRYYVDKAIDGEGNEVYVVLDREELAKGAMAAHDRKYQAQLIAAAFNDSLSNGNQ